ncbi:MULTISPECIES: DMT family transporter [Rhizobium]|uniref:DMT family transporter n=1 Tax=Rhizobium rhododendri TaxID=2506430 RepID=A0ABY8IC75_9HYPH|nr:MULTISPECIES: DMT family transporter [Rhizobium]MBZ5758531.1 DMT family transporter [Rhizobium sp. VS19-DR96]MBZ5764639.1 DMT family transporter [Rhizobium sp. VS19-DR129.2]MBZ5772182.1 DMT family transporter [Rhizobium sp. VS19-DRK62.2]MBZ5783131.1 DMT family transporter [Rhizobium sp. VS19-DR121]MBZ5800579.1 DMT family transporter [Rhizobium sp. VS19-DR181]
MPFADRPQLLGLALGLIGVLIFSATLPFTHIALEGFSPAFITFGRALVASAAAIVTLLVLRRPLPRGHFGQLFAAGLCVVFAFPGFSSIAMQTIPASHGAVVLGLLPLLTAIFAAIIDGERPGILFWICGVIGATLVVSFSVTQNGFQMQPGDLWLFAAAVIVALGYVLLGRLSRSLSGWEAICWALVVTLPISLIGTAMTASNGFHAPTVTAWGAFAYLGLMSMFAGFLFWNAGLAIGGIGRVAQVQLMQTFFTLGISALLLGEHVGLETVGFAMLVAFVVWLGRKARHS